MIWSNAWIDHKESPARCRRWSSGVPRSHMSANGVAAWIVVMNLTSPRSLLLGRFVGPPPWFIATNIKRWIAVRHMMFTCRCMLIFFERQLFSKTTKLTIRQHLSCWKQNAIVPSAWSLTGQHSIWRQWFSDVRKIITRNVAPDNIIAWLQLQAFSGLVELI